MGSLSIALLNSAQAQRTFTQALNIIQTNVSNVNTPGYATQSPQFLNQPFNPSQGLPGGVSIGGLQDSRSTFAEQAVQDQQGYLNQNQQVSTDLTNLNPAFDLNSQSAIPQTVSAFFSSFSTLAVNPNDPTSRQQVVNAANTVAQSFNSTATKLGNAVTQTDNQISETVAAVNADVTAIQQINAQRNNSPDAQHDAGLDAQVYAKLEDLSQYVSFQSLKQPDGSFNLYLGGQTALLVGSHQYSISAAPGNNSTAILDGNSKDITGQITSGKLGGLVIEKNTLLPGYISSLNQLAQSFADTVNNQLSNGVDSTGSAPTASLFTYDPVNGAAGTLAVTTGFQPSQIAAADPAAPGGNGNALTLAGLGQTSTIDGQSFAAFYGSLAGKFGADLSSAQSNTTSAQSLLSQAQANRERISGVSLDQQAAELVQFQQAFQAAGDLFRVLNQLAQDTINLLQ